MFFQLRLTGVTGPTGLTGSLQLLHYYDEYVPGFLPASNVFENMVNASDDVQTPLKNGIYPRHSLPLRFFKTNWFSSPLLHVLAGLMPEHCGVGIPVCLVPPWLCIFHSHCFSFHVDNGPCVPNKFQNERERKVWNVCAEMFSSNAFLFVTPLLIDKAAYEYLPSMFWIVLAYFTHKL